MLKKKYWIFLNILKLNNGLASKIKDAEDISLPTISKIANTGRWNVNTKNKIYNYLIKNSYIKIGQYTSLELFNIEEENKK